jgi:ATP-dependent HslUV protease subunit HslV
MKIAADCCIYTNHNFTIERIEAASSRSSEVVREAASMSASDSFVAAI